MRTSAGRLKDAKETLHAPIARSRSVGSEAAAVVGMMLPEELASPSLVLGLGGASELVTPYVDDIVGLMREVVDQCISD